MHTDPCDSFLLIFFSLVIVKLNTVVNRGVHRDAIDTYHWSEL